jgi:hypothetical protein
VRESISTGSPLDKIVFMRGEFLHGSIQVDTIPNSNDLLPIVREPDEARKSETEFDFSSHVIIVE